LSAHRFTLHTPAGARADPSEHDIERAVAATQAVDGAFAVLERDDGAFVQYDGNVLEWNPGARLQRFDLAPEARDAFGRFARGEDVSTTQPWRDVQTEVGRRETERRRSRRVFLLLLLVLAVAGALLLRYVRGLL
jgi:hypothetical protein